MGGQPQQQMNGLQLGDTTLTKVFVGGLAWETQKDVLREHFDKYGDILEAVIISDKLTGRSKGYGFVTFKEAEAANKACKDPTPIINSRRANCNLASLGARRFPRSSPPPTPHHPAAVIGGVPRGLASGPPAPWYYHPPNTPPLPYHHHHYAGVVPYYPAAAAYGYPPSYITDMAYNAPSKLNHHPQRQFSYPAQAGMATPSGMMPVYPMYHFQHHQSQSMGVPGHYFTPTTATPAGAVTTMPTIISKPAAMPPTTVE